MTARPRALQIALAALALVAVAALGMRLTTQVAALKTAREEIADATTKAAELRAAATSGLGPPLIDARLGDPADLLAQRLKALGMGVRQMRSATVTGAGHGIIVMRFAADGVADASALDRLALWVRANGRSASLRSLSATAATGGKSDVRLELDVLVRQLGRRAT